MKPERCKGKACTSVSPIPGPTVRVSGRRALVTERIKLYFGAAQSVGLAQMHETRGEASKDAGELVDVSARSLSSLRGLGQRRRLLMTGKMQTLAGKEDMVTLQGRFPSVIWGTEMSKAQRGLTQVFLYSQSRAFSGWLIWLIFPWLWRGKEIKCQH